MKSRRKPRRALFTDPRSAVSFAATLAFVLMLVGTSKRPSPTPPSPGVTFSTSGGGGGAQSPRGGAGPADEEKSGVDAGNQAKGRLLREPLAGALPIGGGELDALRFRHKGAVGVREVEAQYVAALVSRGYAVTTRTDGPGGPGARALELSRDGERIVLRLSRVEADVIVSLRLQSSTAD